MHYDITQIKKSQCKTTKWSGGETTELCIYPSYGNYKERDFKWRISTATVDIDESDFTKLPKISRVLMILDGKMILNHENYHNITLNPFEKDIFLGEWKTKSYGKAVDFNIMMDDSCHGELDHFIVNNTINVDLSLRSESYNYTMQGFYLPKGNARVICNEHVMELESGDMVCIYYSHYGDDPNIKIRSEKKVNVVGIHIEY